MFLCSIVVGFFARRVREQTENERVYVQFLGRRRVAKKGFHCRAARKYGERDNMISLL